MALSDYAGSVAVVALFLVSLGFFAYEYYYVAVIAMLTTLVFGYGEMYAS